MTGINHYNLLLCGQGKGGHGLPPGMDIQPQQCAEKRKQQDKAELSNTTLAQGKGAGLSQKVCADF